VPPRAGTPQPTKVSDGDNFTSGLQRDTDRGSVCLETPSLVEEDPEHTGSQDLLPTCPPSLESDRDYPTRGARKCPRSSKRTKPQAYGKGAPCERVSIALVGPFTPRTKWGNSYVLTLADQHTQRVETFPLKEATATNIASCVEHFVCRLGLPLEIPRDTVKKLWVPQKAKD